MCNVAQQISLCWSFARCVNAIRFLSIDASDKAASGHPGMPMGCAPLGYVLFTQHLRANPKDPGFINRDRFVLSAGHGCLLQYALLHLLGYDLTVGSCSSSRYRRQGRHIWGMTLQCSFTMTLRRES